MFFQYVLQKYSYHQLTLYGCYLAHIALLCTWYVWTILINCFLSFVWLCWRWWLYVISICLLQHSKYTFWLWPSCDSFWHYFELICYLFDLTFSVRLTLKMHTSSNWLSDTAAVFTAKLFTISTLLKRGDDEVQSQSFAVYTWGLLDPKIAKVPSLDVWTSCWIITFHWSFHILNFSGNWN